MDEALAYDAQKEIAVLKAAHDEAHKLVATLPDHDDVVALIASSVAAMPTAEEVAALVPKAADGKSVTVDDVRPLIDEAVAGVFAAAPVPKDGKDADPELIKSLVSEAVAALPAPKDGNDATPEQIVVAVDKVLATWERPKDGASVTIEQLLPVVNEEVEKAVAALPLPKDGTGVASVLKDHEGNVVFTLTDGSVCKLGKIDGEPGKDGESGKDIDLDAVRLTIQEEVQKQVMAPLAEAYKGVWKAGAYKRGSVVTWAGSMFIANADTEAKPEESGDWRLAVKRGRDGKDAAEPKARPTVKL